MGKETETSASLPSSGKGHRCAALCGRPAEQRCAGCSDVHYCGRPCQRKHWKTHRLACRAYCVDSSPLVGRRLKASRDLKAGKPPTPLLARFLFSFYLNFVPCLWYLSLSLLPSNTTSTKYRFHRISLPPNTAST